MEKNSVEIEDFLQDEDFVRWVKKPSAESNKYWKTWMEANPEQAPVMLKARELLMFISFSQKSPAKNDREEILADIIRKLDSDSTINRLQPVKNRNFILTSIAASIVLLISVGLFFFWKNENITERPAVSAANSVIIKETPKGIKLQTILPDGTKVWLNADSKVSYDQSYGQKDRVIRLVGEAFFEVIRDTERPFIVQSGKLKVTALGTSFNVRSISGSSTSEVALVTGKVEVENEGGDRDKLILNPGQKAIHKIESPQLLKSDFTIENEIGWKNGIMVFENACFSEIQETLERWYGVDIHSELPKSEEWSYTGKFDNQSLELVLKRLAFIKGFRYKIDGSNVYLFN